MLKRGKTWVFSPSKQSKLQVPDTVKANVEAKASDFIETVLKPKHVRPTSGNEHFNYIVDIYSKWHQSYFYFCAKYASPAPNAISPFFEVKFARLEYIGNERFNLAYMRHTEKWWEIYTGLSLVECLNAIRDEPHFLP
ncbi:MAG: hypothetical protein U0586_09300 [Candidatus Brocadiaceae bacterium]